MKAGCYGDLAYAYNAGAPRLKLTFAYDSQGRRLQKTVHRWENGSFEEDSVTYVLYDRWNPIGQLVQTSHYEIQTYVWGNDLSGTAQGAGGVGGLLMVHSSGETHYPAYDGNGNVVAYIDSDTEDRVAEYEYSPFGVTIRATGPEKDTFPFRFSTKYQDSETALLYYGYRYYDPELGRWLSRDPIEEQGGLNLYGFVGNDGVNRVDVLGLAVIVNGSFSRTLNPTDSASGIISSFDGKGTRLVWGGTGQASFEINTVCSCNSDGAWELAEIDFSAKVSATYTTAKAVESLFTNPATSATAIEYSGIETPASPHYTSISNAAKEAESDHLNDWKIWFDETVRSLQSLSASRAYFGSNGKDKCEIEWKSELNKSVWKTRNAVASETINIWDKSGYHHITDAGLPNRPTQNQPMITDIENKIKKLSRIPSYVGP